MPVATGLSVLLGSLAAASALAFSAFALSAAAASAFALSAAVSGLGMLAVALGGAVTLPSAPLAIAVISVPNSLTPLASFLLKYSSGSVIVTPLPPCDSEIISLPVLGSLTVCVM